MPNSHNLKKTPPTPPTKVVNVRAALSNSYQVLFVVSKNMAARKSSGSVVTQISRQARRFSTAIAPQFTKIESVASLQKINYVHIKINDIAQMQQAVEQYVLRNSVPFDAIEFDLYDKENIRFMQATLFPESIVLHDGPKRICEISVVEEQPCFARIKHPVSGITMYELTKLGGILTITSNTDGMNGYRIVTQNSSLASLLLSCGCLYSKEVWKCLKEDNTIASVAPVRSFFDENSIRVDWDVLCDNELRVVCVCFGVIQMVREAFPQLMHIINQYHLRTD